MKKHGQFWMIIFAPFFLADKIFNKLSRVPSIEKVINENDGDTITIIHSKGAHKIKKEDVLDCRFSCDMGSGENKKLDSAYQNDQIGFRLYFLFAVFCGFLSLMFTYMPLSYFDSEDVERYDNPNLPSGKFSSFLLLVFISYVLTLTVYFCFSSLLKYYRINRNFDFYESDILHVKMNNNYIRIRVGDQGRDLGFINNYATTCSEPNTFYYRLLKEKPIVFSIIIFAVVSMLFISNYKTPFWFYQFIETTDYGIVVNQIFEDSPETLQYWKYYATSDGWDLQNSEPILRYNSDPIRSFFDGMVSGLVFPVLILVVLLLVILIFVLALVLLLLNVLGYGFGGVLAFGVFMLLVDQFNNFPIRRKIRDSRFLIILFSPIKLVLSVLESFGPGALFLSLLIPLFWIGTWTYELGESLMGGNYKYFSWSGSFLTILVAFFLIRTLFKKRKAIEEIVSQNGMELEFQKYRYRNDKEIVEAAIKQNYQSFQFASDELKNDSNMKSVYLSEKRKQNEVEDLGWKPCKIDLSGLDDEFPE
jgi:hypothetical protein